ncbi:hypothetical protein EDB87DRAFT_1685875 [Lactarius vividus]|nr:hypothetical protein EDB87DRAFT_1685875 [Lactarius vividus]
MKYLGCWPPTFPVAVDYGFTSGRNLTPDDEDNMFTTLELSEIRERIRLLRLSITDGVLAEVVALMREPCPQLRHLAISSRGRDTRGQDAPVLPDDFLGGFAPSLREISFSGIPFPALPILLSSASDLVKLILVHIPKTAYFPPAAFAACLAVFPRLEHLSIGFQSSTNQTHLPPETRAALPSLTSFTFVGESAYLEVVVPLVDTPQLYSIDITYTDQQDIQVTELSKLIVRSGIKPSGTNLDEPTIAMRVQSDEEIDELARVMAQVLNQTSAMLSDVVRLEIVFDRGWRLADNETVNNIEWLELFRPFTAVKKLRMYQKMAGSINHALEGQTEEAGTQVLPALRLVYEENPHEWDTEELDLHDRSMFLSNDYEDLDWDDSESDGHAICVTTIDTLTDDALLEIFDLIRSFRADFQVRLSPVWNWRPLVRVCRRWRQIVFTSPLRLDLQLLCTHGKPVIKDLGYWPSTFPIAINYGYNTTEDLTPDDEDNIIAALEQRDRVRHLRFSVTNALLEKMVTLTREPFPELRHLAISSRGLNVPVLPDDFLGGSAPSLREIWLHGIPFPALPTLLSSASSLVELLLVDIPETGHISSAAFAACLAVLPKLAYLSIGFQPSASHTVQTQPPPETRIVLPSLISFRFEGRSTYLEVIMARIDTPQLDSISTTYTDQLDFRSTELSKCIERSGIKPSRFGHAEIFLEDDGISFYLFPKSDPDEPTVTIQIQSNERIYELVYDMAQVLNQTCTLLSDVVRLEIAFDGPVSVWQDDINDDIEWLELFRPFTSVKKLRIYEELAESISHALEGRTEEAGAQVLPALKTICVEDQRTKDVKELTADLQERGKLLSNGDEELDSDDSE